MPEYFVCDSLTEHSNCDNELDMTLDSLIKDKEDDFADKHLLFDDTATVVTVSNTTDCSSLENRSAGNASDIDDLPDDDAYHADDINDMYYGVPMPKCKKPRRETPATIMLCNTIGAIKSRRILKVLFDTGSRKTFINK